MLYGQGTRRPAQRVSSADVQAARFSKPPFARRGYDEGEVDEFLRLLADALATGPRPGGVTPDQVHEITFRKPRLGSRGYDEDEVDAFLDLVESELRWRATPEGQQELAAEGRAPAGQPAVRAVAVAVLVDRGRVLVTELPDPVTGRTVYRPPGTDVRFGERGHETVLRAFGEDFGVGLADVRPLATLESLYRFAGREAHELVLVFEAAPADPALWSQQRLVGRRPDVRTTAIWMPVDAFRRGEAVLLPEGLLPLLDSLPGT